MLKITVHEDAEALTFQVEGKLIGAWAKELEQCWKAKAAIREHRKALIIDLTETLYIDEEGKQTIKKLFRDGAFFRTAGAMTSSVVDEITGKPPKTWRGIVTQAVVLWLSVSVVKGLADSSVSTAALTGTYSVEAPASIQTKCSVSAASLVSLKKNH